MHKRSVSRRPPPKRSVTRVTPAPPPRTGRYPIQVYELAERLTKPKTVIGSVLEFVGAAHAVKMHRPRGFGSYIRGRYESMFGETLDRSVSTILATARIGYALHCAAAIKLGKEDQLHENIVRNVCAAWGHAGVKSFSPGVQALHSIEVNSEKGKETMVKKKVTKKKVSRKAAPTAKKADAAPAKATKKKVTKKKATKKADAPTKKKVSRKATPSTKKVTKKTSKSGAVKDTSVNPYREGTAMANAYKISTRYNSEKTVVAKLKEAGIRASKMRIIYRKCPDAFKFVPAREQ